MVRSKLWLNLVLGSCAFVAHADTVYLSDGTEISGTILEDNSNVVVVKRASGAVQSYRKTNVDAVVYDSTQRPVSKGIAQAEPPTAGKLVTPPVAAVPGTPATPAVPGTPATPAVPGAEKPKAPEAAAKPVTPASPGAAGPSVAQPETPPVAPGDPTKVAPEGPKTAGTDPKTDPKKKEEWTPPPGLAGFPDKAPRMKADKEAAFMKVMNALATPDPEVRSRAKSDMLSFGPEGLPYVIAAAQHSSVDARSSAMDVIGQLPNSSEAIKSVIEMMYSALPDAGEPASYQVPYLRAGKITLHKVTAQNFINVEPSSALIQVGMKSAIDWYKANIDRLPKQITDDPKLDQTDPEYVSKLRKSRELKLARREWPRPPMSADIVNREPVGPGRTNITAKDVLSETDKKLNALPTAGGYDTRNKETTRPVDPRDSALNRK